jgi:hypothetical protein
MSTAQPSYRQLLDAGTTALIDADPAAWTTVYGYYDPDSAAYDEDPGVEGPSQLDPREEGLPIRELVTA